MTGTCRFCGQMKEVNAPDQVRADEKASCTCDCAASGDYARKCRLMKNLYFVTVGFTVAVLSDL